MTVTRETAGGTLTTAGLAASPAPALSLAVMTPPPSSLTSAVVPIHAAMVSSPGGAFRAEIRRLPGVLPCSSLKSSLTLRPVASSSSSSIDLTPTVHGFFFTSFAPARVLGMIARGSVIFPTVCPPSPNPPAITVTSTASAARSASAAGKTSVRLNGEYTPGVHTPPLGIAVPYLPMAAIAMGTHPAHDSGRNSVVAK